MALITFLYYLCVYLGIIHPSARSLHPQSLSSLETGLSCSPFHLLSWNKWLYVTLHGRRDLADVMKSRILTWRDYLDLSEWVQYNHKGHCKREAGGSESEIWQQKQRWEWCGCWLWRQKEAMRQRMWAASGSWKGKETASSLQPPEGRHPSILTPEVPFQTCDIQKCKIIYLC